MKLNDIGMSSSMNDMSAPRENVQLAMRELQQDLSTNCNVYQRH